MQLRQRVVRLSPQPPAAQAAPARRPGACSRRWAAVRVRCPAAGRGGGSESRVGTHRQLGDLAHARSSSWVGQQHSLQHTASTASRRPARLLLRLVEAQHLVPVAVHDAADDVHGRRVQLRAGWLDTGDRMGLSGEERHGRQGQLRLRLQQAPCRRCPPVLHPSPKATPLPPGPAPPSARSRCRRSGRPGCPCCRQSARCRAAGRKAGQADGRQSSAGLQAAPRRPLRTGCHAARLWNSHSSSHAGSPPRPPTHPPTSTPPHLLRDGGPPVGVPADLAAHVLGHRALLARAGQRRRCEALSGPALLPREVRRAHTPGPLCCTTPTLQRAPRRACMLVRTRCAGCAAPQLACHA